MILSSMNFKIAFYLIEVLEGFKQVYFLRITTFFGLIFRRSVDEDLTLIVLYFRSNSCVTNNISFANSKSGISISVQDVDASGGNIQLDR